MTTFKQTFLGTDVAKYDVWYDRATRSWVAQRLDAEGNQLGDAPYVYTRREATLAVNDMSQRDAEEAAAQEEADAEMLRAAKAVTFWRH